MYSLPSTSKMCEPWPRAMNGGVPPTPRKARTGEFTPPGISFWAQANSSSDLLWFMDYGLSFFGDHSLQEDVHQHFLQRSIQVAKQTALQTEIGLRPVEKILDQQAEARAAANEIHHARRHG